jgi:hypothetical protein
MDKRPDAAFLAGVVSLAANLWVSLVLFQGSLERDWLRQPNALVSPQCGVVVAAGVAVSMLSSTLDPSGPPAFGFEAVLGSEADGTRHDVPMTDRERQQWESFQRTMFHESGASQHRARAAADAGEELSEYERAVLLKHARDTGQGEGTLEKMMRASSVADGVKTAVSDRLGTAAASRPPTADDSR